MKIIIDGDACPVIREVESVSKKYKIEVVIVKNYNHVIRSSYSEVISVDSCSENADLKIANITGKGDIIVTQDYGLCAMIIAKDAIAINQYGKVINSFNIDLELYKRDMNREMRMKHKKYT
ncbi:MAG: DUF188 domain-containing protein, partial [Bacillota bacterium]|nr:DUF188 domain-containing protein [Bacillota bacterium]